MSVNEEVKAKRHPSLSASGTRKGAPGGTGLNVGGACCIEFEGALARHMAEVHRNPFEWME